MKKPTTVFFLSLCVVMIFLIAPFRVDAQTPPSSTVTGLISAQDSTAIQAAFVNGTNNWLRRYEPTMVEREQTHVLMTADYDYLLNIELSLTNDEYTITVTVAEEKYNESRAQKICDRISAGVNRAMHNFLIRAIKIDNLRD